MKRLLLPVSAAGFVIPFIRPEFTNLFGVGISYFGSSYIILWNFPEISKSLSSEPLYLKDLEDSPYEDNFIHIMNFTLACLFGLIADYGIIKGILDKTLVEILAIIGGNMALFTKIETTIGKLCLTYVTNAKFVQREKEECLMQLKNMELKYKKLFHRVTFIFH